jgi:hypothetical protein
MILATITYYDGIVLGLFGIYGLFLGIKTGGHGAGQRMMRSNNIFRRLFCMNLYDNGDLKQWQSVAKTARYLFFIWGSLCLALGLIILVVKLI